MRRRTLHLLAVSCFFSMKAVHYVQAFAGLESVVVQSSALPPLLQHAATNSWHAVQDTVMAFLPSPPPPPSLVQSVVTTAAAAATAASHNMAAAYAHALEQNALATQMVTGGVLALTGDAIAQYTQQQQQQQQAKQQQQQQIVVPQAGNDLSATAVATTSTTTTTLSFQYDTLRATSFVLFDVAYRALQHVAFPAIVQHCHGQYLSALFSFLPSGSSSSSSMVYDFLSTQDLAAMEQTLANQLFIIPFLYYPVFFALTGYIQNLTLVESWQRALETFPVVMPRNLLFWIPVQYYQFRYLPADLHIPFVCVAGLCWTVILSLAAGSTTKTATTATATTDEQQGQTVVLDNMLVEQLSAYDEDEQRQQLVDMKGRATVRP